MKIGIYNRYWNTCGGGENYTGSVAEDLSEDHEVELISIEPVDWARIESRLRLDLSRCSTKQWPNEPCSRLSPLSAHYDLFINSTYSSSIMPHSPQSALICYFPHRIDSLAIMRSRALYRINEFLKRSKGGLLKFNCTQGVVITPVAGVFQVEPDGRSWLGTNAILTVAGLSSHLLRIPLWPTAHNGIKSVKVSGRELPWRIDGTSLCIECKSTPAEVITLSIVSGPMVPLDSGTSTDSRQLGACIDTRRISWVDNQMESFRQSKKDNPQASLSKYDRIISISKFTSEWIGRRWNLPSIELQPPIDTNVFSADRSTPKEKIILSVGRFFAAGHNKKHHEIASAFIRMRREGYISEEWRLVLVGARHLEHQKHIEYFDKLQALCAGHPIDIKPDLPFTELLTYYRRASIYWHAAGWGEQVEQYPERFEHFGMTTCEAMACGCVPVVFDAAGQKEIVNSTEIGFRFSSYEMLAQQMKFLTNADPKVLSEIGIKAQLSITRFSSSSFKQKVRDTFQGLAY